MRGIRIYSLCLHQVEGTALQTSSTLSLLKVFLVYVRRVEIVLDAFLIHLYCTQEKYQRIIRNWIAQLQLTCFVTFALPRSVLAILHQLSLANPAPAAPDFLVT